MRHHSLGRPWRLKTQTLWNEVIVGDGAGDDEGITVNTFILIEAQTVADSPAQSVQCSESTVHASYNLVPIYGEVVQ